MEDKETKKELKFKDYLDSDVRLSFYALHKLMKGFFTKEMKKAEKKEKEYEGLWKFINNYKIRDSFSEEFKIILTVVFIVVFAIWVGDKNSIPVAHSDSDGSELEITNAHTKEDIDKGKESVEIKTDVKDANENKFESSEKSCEKNKEQKKSSELCGKDDEEEVKKIEDEKEEEERKRAAAAKPKIVKLSCREDDYGDPSESDTKGKHKDEDCCPDPDEWPKPGCTYDAHGYSIMLKGPK